MAKTSPTSVKLTNGKQVNLKFDFNAFTRLDEDCEMNLFDPKFRKAQLSPKFIRNFIWAGLLHAMPELQLADAAKLMELTRMGEYTEAIEAAIQTAMTLKK